MKSILVTYPNFRGLPKGIKKLLVTSENLFFAEAAGRAPAGRARQDSPRRDRGRRQPVEKLNRWTWN